MSTTKRHRRAPRGSGSVYQNSSRAGTWIAEIRLDGKRVRRSFPSRAAAAAFLESTQPIEAPRRGKGGVRLRDWLPAWLEGLRGIEPKTLTFYRWAARAWADSPLGGRLIAALEVDEVEAQLGEFSTTMERQSVMHLRRVLSTALNAGMRKRIVLMNVAHLARVPGRAQPPRIKTIKNGPGVMRAVGSAVVRSPLADAFVLMMSTGMRPGELLALQVGDITVHDIYTATISVRRSIKSRPTKTAAGAPQSRWYIAGGKNEFSAREVAITGAELIARWRRAAKGRGPSAWLFPSPSDPDMFVNPEQFSKEFRRRVDAFEQSRRGSGQKQSELRAYDLRGLHITHLVSLGEDVVSIAARVGHKDPVTLLRRYAGVVQGRDREVAISAREPLKPRQAFSTVGGKPAEDPHPRRRR
jgi:integrase